MSQQPVSFTPDEWRRLDPALQVLGEVGALTAIIDGGNRIFDEWDSMSRTEQEAASRMAATWPKADEEELPDEIVEHVQYKGAVCGTPRYEVWEHVRECRHRLIALQEWQRHQNPENLEADIQALIDDGYIANRQAVINWLEQGFTLQVLREMTDSMRNRPERQTVP